MHILMVAAENGALSGGKVGGIGDVIRDIPGALAAAGDTVTVITPGYQSLSRQPGAHCINSLSVIFNNVLHEVFVYRIENAERNPGIHEIVLDCPAFAPCGDGKIYCHDKHEPFALDAGKFALFCNAVCLGITSGAFEQPDVIHLHDWHAALVLFLRRFNPAFRALADIPCVYTIHNLSIQGVRPLRGNPSSLDAWFPDTDYTEQAIVDPRHPDCVNMMRMGINLADRVHVVSPTYAREILKPSDYDHGFIGGEGLEKDLQLVATKGSLFGILNGCDYHDIEPVVPDLQELVLQGQNTLEHWVDDRELIKGAHFHAYRRLLDWQANRTDDGFKVISVGRLSGQKVHLLRQEYRNGHSVMAGILDYLSDHDGLFIMLGSGDSKYEQFMSSLMQQYDNFVFLNGFSEAMAATLYRAGDLFLMPSSYEPCGISQMLAMRAGVPCLVHRTGGLADTVKNGHNGFSFGGNTPRTQAGNLVKTFREAHRLFSSDSQAWQTVCRHAGAARFTWEAAITEYRHKLYRQ